MCPSSPGTGTGAAGAANSRDAAAAAGTAETPPGRLSTGAAGAANSRDAAAAAGTAETPPGRLSTGAAGAANSRDAAAAAGTAETPPGRLSTGAAGAANSRDAAAAAGTAETPPGRLSTGAAGAANSRDAAAAAGTEDSHAKKQSEQWVSGSPCKIVKRGHGAPTYHSSKPCTHSHANSTAAPAQCLRCGPASRPEDAVRVSKHYITSYKFKRYFLSKQYEPSGRQAGPGLDATLLYLKLDLYLSGISTLLEL
ncbi:hypothetical protein PLESTB_001719800 [Pleodorina starrii]|uniref:Uncharacterized protein n=1 Tax=Pleodorina starrii TaxID=330485 RepID=A0A9W6BZH5_9CHLO|nr:hypothetical protein PLESTB_001719800 [Pleodorina starrii]